MHVTHLSLTDFRSYPTVALDLRPGPTAIVGPNGQGKTNLVEAIGYVATLASHRVAQDAPLVRAGAERAVVRAAVARAGRSTLVELEISPGRANRARLNSSPLPRARDVLGALRTVLFAPEDLSLAKGDPDGRRRFLDDLLVLLAPRLAGVRADYDRVLKQRNALLKSAGRHRVASRSVAGASEMATLDVWDERLAQLGGELLSARLYLVDRLGPPVLQAYQDISGADGLAVLGYRSSLPMLEGRAEVGGSVPSGASGSPAEGAPNRVELAEAMLAELTRQRPREVERGMSLVGPHRDDMLLQLGDLPARGYASHGESWSYALALRLASYELLTGDGAAGDGEPVLILDDVFAELDTGRRSRLAARVAAAEQVLVTAAVEDDVPAELAGDRVTVRAGEVARG